MEYLLIGKLVNTHALKGEVRILSYFQYKDLIFKEGFNFYIGEEKKKLKVETYRKHKNYDMVKFKEYSDILDVQVYKGKNVYVLKEDIHLDGKILDCDLITLAGIFNNRIIGNVDEIINNNGYKVIVLGKTLIPYNNTFIEKIDLANKKILFKNVEEFINED